MRVFDINEIVYLWLLLFFCDKIVFIVLLEVFVWIIKGWFGLLYWRMGLFNNKLFNLRNVFWYFLDYKKCVFLFVNLVRGLVMDEKLGMKWW